MNKNPAHRPSKPTDVMVHAMRAMVRRIPHGHVATYAQVAAAAGYPGLARQVARALRSLDDVPWQRVVGAGGVLRLRGANAQEQRLRLQLEGVQFQGKRVPMEQYQVKDWAAE